MHHTQFLFVFSIALVLMFINLLVQITPAQRSGSPARVQAAFIRIAVINGIVLLASVAYVVTHR